MLFRNDKDKNDKKDGRDGQGDTVPLLPLRELIVFPHQVYPIFVGRQKSIKALEAAEARKQPILLVAQKDAKVSDPGPQDIYAIGTLGVVVQLLRLPDGTVKALLEGKKRARESSRYVGRGRVLPGRGRGDRGGLRPHHRARGADSFGQLDLRQLRPAEQEDSARDGHVDRRRSTIRRTWPTSWSNIWAIKLEDKQALLECANPAERLEKILGYMRSELEILEVEKRIRSRVKKQMEKTQKEYYLNEQMRAIQKELGEKDEFKNEIQELEEKLRQKKMPAEAREKCEREIKKLKMMSPMSAEATVVRNYLDWFLALPWFEYTEDKLDIKEAERILEEDHYGLEKVKQRILEYLAVQTLVGQMKGPILCLVGPPGVGKTSLGKSIARATGRKFVRVSLGGVRDEAEIRGHRRTYIGALPGKIIQSMRKAGSGNPVMLLDEVDKMSTDFRGDPSSALLEVLDPEQNCTFNDHYLDCDYDLSKVMFITTANTLERIPRPLQDRMEIIRIPGYTETEKLNIAKRYLVQKQREANGLQRGEHRVLRPGDPADHPATTRARPACVTSSAKSPRSAARSRSKWSRPIATRTFAFPPPAWPSSSDRRASATGWPKPSRRSAWRPGLAWTEMGGELLGVEVTIVPGRGKLTVTGQLGDVMQESAQAAMSYVRSRADALGLASNFYQKIDIHIHIPEGAIAQGRSLGRHHAGDGAGLGAMPRAGAQRPGDDRRDHAARARAADRRAQGEGPRGASRRHQDRAHPQGERQGHRRYSGSDSEERDPDPGRAHGRGAAPRAGAGGSGCVLQGEAGRDRLRRRPEQGRTGG